MSLDYKNREKVKTGSVLFVISRSSSDLASGLRPRELSLIHKAVTGEKEDRNTDCVERGTPLILHVNLSLPVVWSTIQLLYNVFWRSFVKSEKNKLVELDKPKACITNWACGK